MPLKSLWVQEESHRGGDGVLRIELLRVAHKNNDQGQNHSNLKDEIGPADHGKGGLKVHRSAEDDICDKKSHCGDDDQKDGDADESAHVHADGRESGDLLNRLVKLFRRHLRSLAADFKQLADDAIAPIFHSMASMMATDPTIPIMSGAIKSGRRAMDSKVRPGAMKTPSARLKKESDG